MSKFLRSAADWALRFAVIGGAVGMRHYATRGGLPTWLSWCAVVLIVIAAGTLEVWAHATAYRSGIKYGRDLELRRPERRRPS